MVGRRPPFATSAKDGAPAKPVCRGVRALFKQGQEICPKKQIPGFALEISPFARPVSQECRAEGRSATFTSWAVVEVARDAHAGRMRT